MTSLFRNIARILNVTLFAGICATCVSGQGAKKPAPTVNTTSGEQRPSLAFDAAKNNPSALYAFLYRMPKGSDLHNHLSGAVYAESWIKAAGEDHLCVNTSTDAFAPQVSGACTSGTVAAETVPANQTLYDALIDAFSMRAFVPTPGVNGHDHFFSTFAKFGGTDSRHTGEWLDEVATRAAAQNEQYLELMDTPTFTHAATIAHQIGWNSDLGAFRNALLAAGLKDEVATDRAHYDQADAVRNQREHCGQSDAADACRVQIRYIYQILRGYPKEQVFAQTLLGFEVASVDPRVVGINYVMPEDGYTSMADYALHMQIVGFLHNLYPKVHISLHAGELAPGLVPYESLCCHIRQAVEVAHAERIGHGVDVMYENNPTDLLREMAAKHVMVEINLTSNDVILGVSGKEHPLPMYRKFGVPVSLSTDDEGVSRINMTHEYVRLAETYGLSYPEMKKMVREGIEHTFLPGDSLWNAPEAFGHPATACAQDQPGSDKPSARCAAFLKSSEHAQQQWELERRFREFESSKF